MIERIIAYPNGEGNAWADAREYIVRCRDCKYRADRGRRHYCDAHFGGFFEVAADDFCAWGEKREERKLLGFGVEVVDA